MVETLVAMVVIGILVALLFPAGSKLIASSQATKCVGNQRAIASALITSATENDGFLPAYQGGAEAWWEAIRPYLGIDSTKSVGYNYMRCPAAGKEISTTIGVNYAEVPGCAPFGRIGDVAPGVSGPGSMKLALVGRGTILTADIENPSGHLWFLSPNQFPLTIDTDGDGINDSRPGKPSNNWFAPRHNHSAVCSFADGSAKVVPLAAWARNEDKMWGH